MKIKLFTHTDLDGIGCAILAYLAFGRENVEVEYCDYSNIDDKVGDFLVNGAPGEYDKVFITDISISNELAMAIDKYAVDDLWYLFDHHDTAIYLNAYDWCQVLDITPITHIKTCGTELFYRYIFNNLIVFQEIEWVKLCNIQKFVVIVRDWDTWRWKELGDEGLLVSKQVNDLFDIYGREGFIDWAMEQIGFSKSPMHEFPNFTDIDKALLEQRQKDIDRYVEEKSKQIQEDKDQFGNVYGWIFAERYFSELGNRLCELHPEYAYIAMVNVAHGTISYRTIHDDIDLGGEIAHAYGGGGHKKAAGITFDSYWIMDTIMNFIMFG